MAIGQKDSMIGHLRRAAILIDGGSITDGQLLRCFLSQRDEAAFQVLVKRHAAMVMGVCRRVLRNEHDAEDAFQATFMVLVRKAASIGKPELLSNWLYGVAYRTALEARATEARRRKREKLVSAVPEPAAVKPNECRELLPLLDRELSGLPDKYRSAVVLCDLEGKTRKEAARQLGIPEGTLSGRLTTARRLLARRLRRHGSVVSGGALGAAFSQAKVSAEAPAALVYSTGKAAGSLAGGTSAAVGILSAKVIALADGVIKAMLLTKLKVIGVLLVALLLSGVGAAVLTPGALADKPAASKQAAPKADAKPAAAPMTDEQKIQGAWKIVKWTFEGKDTVWTDKAPVSRWYLTDNTVYWVFGHENTFSQAWTYEIDSTAKPKRIDKWLAYDERGTDEGIYQLDGDELKVCWGHTTTGRPTDFTSKPQSRRTLVTLKRDPKAPRLDVAKAEAARQAQAERNVSVNKLKTLALAMHNYKADHGNFPPAAIYEDGKPLLSWRVALLSVVDKNLYQEFKLDEPWDSKHNKKLLEKMPEVYGTEGTETFYQVFTGPNTPFDGMKGLEDRDFTDGFETTILIVEAGTAVPWTKPADLEYDPNKPLPKLGGLYKEGFHIALGDGSVLFLSSKLNEKVLRAMITRNGGEKVEWKDLATKP